MAGNYTNRKPSMLIRFLALLFLATNIQAAEVELTGNVTLRWLAPTENVDGTPLTDLTGYRVYFGRESRSYELPIDIDASGTSGEFTLPIADPSDLQWFFAMTALDADGNESGFSNEIRKDITLNIDDRTPPAAPALEEVILQLECTTDSAFVTCEVFID